MEEEKLEHDYIVVHTKSSLREMELNIEEFGVFSEYYAIKDELEKGELINERD